MKGKYIPFLVLPLFLFVFLLLSPMGIRAEEGEIVDEKKVELCHAKTPKTAKNGYNYLNIAKQAVFKKGHSIHEKDIIPPFSYIVKEKIFVEYDYKEKKNDGSCHKNYEEYGDEVYCRKEVFKNTEIEKEFPGTNWNEGGKKVLGLKCILPEMCVYKTDPVVSDWSDWLGELGTLNIYRIRTSKTFDIIARDLFDESYLCDNIEDRYDACDVVTTKVVEGQWKVDPVDSTKEYKVTTTYKLDSTDEEVVCDSSEVRATRDITTTDDEPDVSGVTDKVEEVGVVLAETGSSSNIFVYVIQSILMLSTLASGALFVKRFTI